MIESPHLRSQANFAQLMVKSSGLAAAMERNQSSGMTGNTFCFAMISAY